MKKLLALCVAAIVAAPLMAGAQDAKSKAKETDLQAMHEMMMKAAAPGPQHERFKSMAGDWNLTVKMQMDPSQPAQEAQSTSTIKTLMDGRYMQEESSGQMMGMPFNGMGITGYDNLAKKYVSIWIDNMGTGIMKSEGVADAGGNVINWTAQAIDPMTGKPTKYRMVTRFVDNDHHVFEMYAPAPGSKKEMKTMTIEYARKM